MNHDLDATADLLADAMVAGTDGLHARPDLPARVAARRRQGTRRAVLGTSGGIAALVALVVIGAGTLGEDGPAKVTPAASASASPSTPTAAQGRHSVFEVTVVPAAYAFDHGTTDPFGPSGTHGVNERVSYRRAGSRALITVQTFTGTDRAMQLSDFKDSPGAEVVQIGSRQVFHVPNMVGAGGLNVYEWTEEVGLDVMVDGRSGATDAELRAVVAGLRRRA